jgi:hypothetical protein
MRGRWRWGKIWWGFLLLLIGGHLFLILAASQYLFPPYSDEVDDRWEVIEAILALLVIMGVGITIMLRHRYRDTGPLDGWFRASVPWVKAVLEDYLGEYDHIPVKEGENERMMTHVHGNEVNVYYGAYGRRTVVWVDPVPVEGREEFMVWLDGLTDALRAAEKES